MNVLQVQFQQKITEEYRNQKNVEEKAFNIQLSEYEQAFATLSPKIDESLASRSYEGEPVSIRAFIDKDGILLEEYIPTSRLKRIRNKLQFKTKPKSPAGMAVRRVVNRALVSAQASKGKDTEEGAENATGSIALALGADLALVDRKIEDAKELLRLGALTVDISLGFLPVVSSINDASQIILGMVTGHDYTGSRMTHADYALRGTGVVLGIIPTGVIRLAGKAIDQGFISGAKILRTLKLDKPANNIWNGFKSDFTVVLSYVGRRFGLVGNLETSRVEKGLAESLGTIGREIQTVTDTLINAKNLTCKHEILFLQILHNAKHVGKNRLELALVDGSKLVIRRDVGVHAHRIKKIGGTKRVNHYNLEIHIPDPNKINRFISKENFHVILDENFSPIQITR